MKKIVYSGILKLVAVILFIAAITSAFFASKTFAAVLIAPRGKPITVQTATSVPFSKSAQRDTQQGLTQTEAKPYSAASAHSRRTAASVVWGFKTV